MQQPELSVIIPAYNEEKVIYDTIRNIRDFLDKYKITFEIIVVDDGSKDKTAVLVKSLDLDKRIKYISNGVNRGKGFSVRNGASHSSGKYILFTDADNSTPIYEVLGFLVSMNTFNNDLVIGSRRIEGARIFEEQGKLRLLVGWVFRQVVGVMSGIKFKDTQCGFKMVRASVGKELYAKMKVDRFSFDIELLLLAQKAGMKIKELPVHWQNRKESKVSPLKDGVRMAWDLFLIRIRFFLGKY